MKGKFPNAPGFLEKTGMSQKDRLELKRTRMQMVKTFSETLTDLNFEAVTLMCADPDYKNRIQFVATAKLPTLRLKLSSGVDSLRQSKVFIARYQNCCQN